MAIKAHLNAEIYATCDYVVIPTGNVFAPLCNTGVMHSPCDRPSLCSTVAITAPSRQPREEDPACLLDKPALEHTKEAQKRGPGSIAKNPWNRKLLLGLVAASTMAVFSACVQVCRSIVYCACLLSSSLYSFLIN